MSKMGQELERRLDENKYELWEALRGIMENGAKMEMGAQTALKMFPYIKQAEKVLAKIEGK